MKKTAKNAKKVVTNVKKASGKTVTNKGKKTAAKKRGAK